MMTPSVRKVALTAHVTSSVGWIGAFGSFLALALAGLVSQDAQIVRAAYPPRQRWRAPICGVYAYSS